MIGNDFLVFGQAMIYRYSSTSHMRPPKMQRVSGCLLKQNCSWGGGRGQGEQLLLGYIKSVDGFVFFRLSYFDYSDLQLFDIFIQCSRSIFWRHISWQVLKISFRSLQIWKFSGGGYLQILLQGSCMPSALATMPPPLACVQTSPISFIARGKGTFA